MTALAILFYRLILRSLVREPLRAFLTALSVALGVAVVVAIDLAGTAAAGSFHSAVETLTASAEFEITQTGGVDEQLLGRLAQLPEPFVFSPRIEDFATVDGRGEAVLFLGLDLVAESLSTADVRPAAAEELPRPAKTEEEASSGGLDPIWVGPGFGRKPGDRIRLLINDRFHWFRVQGILSNPNAGAAAGSENILVTDIGLAQALTGKVGRLDSISVVVPHGRRSPDEWAAYLRQRLPAAATIEPRGARTSSNRKMLEAFRANLRVLSYIALIVGAFLIYNTISISVVRRRTEIGIVRALGASRLVILAAFFGEALVFAAIGSAAGLAGGRFLALGAVRLLGATVRALYTTADPAPVVFSLSSVIAALLAGVGVSMLAALAPALEAARVAPVEAMAHGREEMVAHHRSRWSVPLAFLISLLAFGAALLPARGTTPLFGYVSCVLFIGAATIAVPALVKSLAARCSTLAGRWMGVEAMLALRSLESSLSRSSVLIAALATAVAMMASVAIMVGSFRETVSAWLDQRLEADFYLSPASPASADRHPHMDAGIADQVAHLPGVAAVDRFRAYSIYFQGLPATLAGGETVSLGRYSRIRLLPGEPESAIRMLAQGDYVLVSEPFANKHHVTAGGTIRLPLGKHVVSFRIAGVFYDYSTERGFITMDRSTLLKYLPDPAVSDIAVYLKPGADPPAVRAAIDRVISGRAIAVIPHAAIRREGMATFDRTFRITWALEAVAIAVAIMGIASALLAMVLDRRREFGLFRFLGASVTQVRSLILAEAAFLGLLANCVGVVLGIALSLVLIYVINRQSFGWTIQFHWPVALLISALTLVYAATLAAALYPARTAMRLNPIEVVHED